MSFQRPIQRPLTTLSEVTPTRVTESMFSPRINLIPLWPLKRTGPSVEEPRKGSRRTIDERKATSIAKLFGARPKVISLGGGSVERNTWKVVQQKCTRDSREIISVSHQEVRSQCKHYSGPRRKTNSERREARSSCQLTCLYGNLFILLPPCCRAALIQPLLPASPSIPSWSMRLQSAAIDVYPSNGFAARNRRETVFRRCHAALRHCVASSFAYRHAGDWVSSPGTASLRIFVLPNFSEIRRTRKDDPSACEVFVYLSQFMDCPMWFELWQVYLHEVDCIFSSHIDASLTPESLMYSVLKSQTFALKDTLSCWSFQLVSCLNILVSAFSHLISLFANRFSTIF